MKLDYPGRYEHYTIICDCGHSVEMTLGEEKGYCHVCDTWFDIVNTTELRDDKLTITVEVVKS